MKKIILVLLTALILSFSFAFCVSAEDTKIADIAYEVGQNEGFANFSVNAITLVPDEVNSVVISGYTVVDDKQVDWTEKYELTLNQYLELFKVNNSNLVYDAATCQNVPENASKIIIDVMKPQTLDVELEYNGFGSDGFLRNIKYMGLGMVGIFVVVGIVMLITYILNNVTGKKKA